jgi:gliding motility-associated-like protein
MSLYLRWYIPILACVFFTVHVHAQSVGGTVNGPTQFCNSSGGVFISLSGETGTITAWEMSINGGTSWTNTGTLSNPQPVNNLTTTTCYRAIVKSGSFDPDTSSIHCIIIYPQSIGGTVTGGGTYCVGEGGLKLSAHVGSILRWQSSVNNGANWTNISNTTDTLTFTGITQSTRYEAVVQTNALCTMDTSTSASITISPSVSGIISGGGTYCGASGNGIITLSNYTGDTIHWLYSVDEAQTWILLNETNDTLSYTTSTTNRYYKAFVKLGNCPADTTTQLAIQIENSIAGTIVNNDTTVEYNSSNDFLRLKGHTGTVSAWLMSENEGLTWTTITTNDSVYHYLNLITTTLYKAIVQQNSCTPDTSNTIKITVLPKAVADIPNLFTPNGDGFNDTWYIKGIENFPSNEVTIINKDGAIVFSKKRYTNDWTGTYNGNTLPDGTYYYIVKVEEANLLLKGAVDILSNK